LAASKAVCTALGAVVESAGVRDVELGRRLWGTATAWLVDRDGDHRPSTSTPEQSKQLNRPDGHDGRETGRLRSLYDSDLGPVAPLTHRTRSSTTRSGTTPNLDGTWPSSPRSDHTWTIHLFDLSYPAEAYILCLRLQGLSSQQKQVTTGD